MKGRNFIKEPGTRGEKYFSITGLYVPVAVCCLLFASCVTSPKAGPVVLEDGVPDFSVLPQGGNVYFWADVNNARPLLEVFSFNGVSLEGKDASQILDRTDTAVAAFYPAEAAADSGSSMAFFVAGQGKYPVLGTGISMGLNRYWKQKRSPGGNRYWYSETYNLGAAIGSRIAFISDGDPFAGGASSEPAGIEPLPQGFEEFRKGTVLSGWHNNAGVQVNSIASGMGIPITIPVDGLFFGFALAPLEPGQPAKYETALRVKTPSASHAVMIVSLLSIARSVLSFDGDEPVSLVELLLSNAPIREGQDMLLHIPPMTAAEMAPFLSMFFARSGS